MFDAVHLVITEEDRKVNSYARKLVYEFRQKEKKRIAALPTREERIDAWNSAGFPTGDPVWTLMEREFERDRADFWGFVCFRTDYNDQGTWELLQLAIEHEALQAVKSNKMPESVANRFKISYVEDKDKLARASRQTLIESSEELKKTEGKIPRGVRTDYFISVDDNAILAFQKSRVELIFWDADFTPSLEVSPEYTGVTRTTVLDIFFSMFPSIVMGSNPLKLRYNLKRFS
jgi:hypothetical protein